MSIYHPTNVAYRQARAAYEMVYKKNGWPDWNAPEADKYRKLMIRTVREQRGEIEPEPRKLWVRCYMAVRAGVKEFRRP